MNSTQTTSLFPILSLGAGFLIVYTVGIIYLFTRTRNGQRRRWAPLDFVWVPMGGLTGILILALWWQSR